MKSQREPIDETNVTELEIGTDGRIYVFGASPEVLQILEQLQLTRDSLRPRLTSADEHQPQSCAVREAP